MNELKLEEQFNISSIVIKNLTKRPEDNELLTIYGLYKQATIGDCNTMEPTGLLNIKEKSKWSNWKKLENMSRKDAMIKYIRCVEYLVNKYK